MRHMPGYGDLLNQSVAVLAIPLSRLFTVLAHPLPLLEEGTRAARDLGPIDARERRRRSGRSTRRRGAACRARPEPAV
jgi:hypothetical protein